MPRRPEAGLARESEMTKTPRHLQFVRDGGVEALIVSAATLYFDPTSLDDERLRTAYRQGLAWVRPQLRFYRARSVVRLRPARPLIESLVEHWCRLPRPQRRPLYVELTSAPSDQEVGPFTLRLQVPAEGPAVELGALRVTWPAALALQQPEVLGEAFLDLAQRLSPAWGAAGFSIEWDTRRVITERDDRMRAWCSRFRCIDHSDFDHVGWLRPDCLAAIGWLNLLPAGLPDEAKGRPTMLYASPVPMLGDRNRNEDVSGMAALYAKLRDHLCPPGALPAGFDEESFGAWRDRFESEN